MCILFVQQPVYMETPSMVLYHGGYCAVASPEIRTSRLANDFGQGFYCAEMLEQAKRWASRFATASVNAYDFFQTRLFRHCVLTL
jgi:hypothetical protein